MSTEQNTITVIGNLTKDPELRYTASGVAVANLSVAVNRRVRNKDTGDWEDKLDGYFDTNIWRDHAENVAESLTKGDRVVVIGRLVSRSWEDREGQTRWVTEIEADEICPSLRWARASISKVRGGGGRRWGRWRCRPGRQRRSPQRRRLGWRRGRRWRWRQAAAARRRALLAPSIGSRRAPHGPAGRGRICR